MPFGTEYKDLRKFGGGIELPQTQSNVHDTAPTIAQLTTEFASAPVAATVPVRIVNDAAGGVNVYIAANIGSDYFFVKMTKAA